ncbi:MAG: hypothetical protein ABWK01_09220 [Infirmifilum sp.]
METQLPSPPPPKQRPLGVTVLAILGFLGGALLLLLGLVFIALGPLVRTYLEEAGHLTPMLTLIAGILGFFLLVFGGITLLVSWGLYTGRAWAWWVQVILTALQAVNALLGIALGDIFSLLTLLIDALILYYFFKPHVKDFFGVKVSFST